MTPLSTHLGSFAECGTGFYFYEFLSAGSGFETMNIIFMLLKNAEILHRVGREEA